MSEPFEIRLKELEEWLKQETLSITQPLKGEAKKLVTNVEGKLDGIRDISEKMLGNSEREMSKSSPKTYRRAKAVSKLTQKTLEILDSASIPDEISYEDLELLYEDLDKTISAIGQERAKWVRYIEPYFILDRRRFDVALKRTVDSLGELQSFFSNEYVKVKDVEEALSAINKIVGMLDELDGVEKRKKLIESRRRELEREIAEKQKEITVFQDQSEVSELSKVNEEIKDLKKQMKHNVRHLQKPFLKFQKLTRSSKYDLSSNEADKLTEYLKKPFVAFATEEEKYPLLKNILQRMEDAINEKKMKLKSSRLRKAQEQMENILHRGTLDSFHKNCKTTFLRKQYLLTSKTVSTYRKESEQIRVDLKTLKKRKSLVNSRLAILDNTYRKTREKIESSKRELEEDAQELTGKPINIILKRFDFEK